jgi:hypothetical protein
MGTYDATLYNRNFTTTGSSHTIVKSPSGVNSWSYPGTCGDETATATSRTGITSGFSDLATIYGAVPLNAVRLDLVGVARGRNAELMSALPSLKNAQALELLRGRTPEALSSVHQTAYAPTDNVFRQVDTDLKQGVYYYQLLARDANGASVAKSDVVAVRFNQEAANRISAWPNPADAQLFISLPAGVAATAHLLDIAGKRVYENIISPAANTGQLNLPTHTIADGVYTLVVNADGARRHFKVVVRH